VISKDKKEENKDPRGPVPVIRNNSKSGGRPVITNNRDSK
jgi:hypothetical protein